MEKGRRVHTRAELYIVRIDRLILKIKRRKNSYNFALILCNVISLLVSRKCYKRLQFFILLEKQTNPINLPYLTKYTDPSIYTEHAFLVTFFQTDKCRHDKRHLSL